MLKQIFRWKFAVGLLLSWAIAFLLVVQPIVAQTTPERAVLTLDLLQERLEKPVLREGSLTVDLRNLKIDLQPENREFQQEFYQLLHKEFQKAGVQPLGLDLSDSLIEGDFLGGELGIRTTLHSQVISPSFVPGEQEQLERLRSVCLQQLEVGLPSGGDCNSLLDERFTSSTDISVFRGALTLKGTQFRGAVSFGNTFFLQPVNAKGATFEKTVDFQETRFSRSVNFSQVTFQQDSQWGKSIFFDKVDFKSSQFADGVEFPDSSFEDNANFHETIFAGQVKFNRSQWWGNVDFSQVRFNDRVQFTRSRFQGLLLLGEATFEEAVTFRSVIFSQPVSLQGAIIVNQADFSDVELAKSAYLNVSGLGFNSNQAKILGSPNQIGNILRVSKLQGNQSVLRNLVQNFRSQQQIGDVNQLEYTRQQLALRELTHRLMGMNINSVPPEKLIKFGFTFPQIKTILERREIQPFTNRSELLTLPEIDFNTYIQIDQDILFGEPMVWGEWLVSGWSWLILSLLLLLSGYGTNFSLVLGVGLITIAYFGILFWLVDRFRRFRPFPIIPTWDESMAMGGSFICLNFIGLVAVFRSSQNPWLTLTCLGIIIVPIPSLLVIRLYQAGRFHDQLKESYFTEDSSMRQLRLLIGRLPVIPRFPGFRDRYVSILWDKHWNWLNYYDFSLNNLLRLGFNDIRLRDENLPGIISALAWYQWGVGVLYLTLALWTLSRTIPGLNLLIYLK